MTLQCQSTFADDPRTASLLVSAASPPAKDLQVVRHPRIITALGRRLDRIEALAGASAASRVSIVSPGVSIG